MARQKKDRDLLDMYVREVADEESKRTWWKIDPIARQAVVRLTIPKMGGMDLPAILLKVAKLRAREYFASARDSHGLRLYETYADGSQGRRWRRVKDMTADDFERVLPDYRLKTAGMERVIRVYEDFLETLRSAGDKAKVSDVYDTVVARQQAAGNLR